MSKKTAFHEQIPGFCSRNHRFCLQNPGICHKTRGFVLRNTGFSKLMDNTTSIYIRMAYRKTNRKLANEGVPNEMTENQESYSI